MKTNRLIPLTLAALLAVPLLSLALSPIQIGLAGPDGQLVPVEEPVCGLRLNLPFSENDFAAGLDLGIFSLASTFTGIQFDLFAWTEQTFTGLGLAFFHSAVDLNGIQLGFFPTTEGTLSGVQFGAFPKAADMRGLQMGVVTRADSLRGIQIGIINIVSSADLSWTPLLRISW